jgi:stress response protein SCP2
MALKSMKQGDKLSLVKEGDKPVLNVRIELSWITNKEKSIYEFDFDGIILGTRGDGIGKSVAEELVCYYLQPTTVFASSVKGDNTKGNVFDAAGNKLPDEVYRVCTSAVPAEVEHIPVIVNLHHAKIRGQSFSDAPNMTITVFDDDTNEKLATGILTDVEPKTTSVLFAMINRAENGKFIYEQVNKSYQNKTLENWFNEVGIEVEN